MAGKGNRRKQNLRRVQRFKEGLPPKQKVTYQLIDGNFSYYPVLFCEYHKAYLTEGLIDLHRCRKRHCKRLRRFPMIGKIKFYLLHYFENYGNQGGEPMGTTHSEYIWATPNQMKEKERELKKNGYSDISYEEADPITKKPLNLGG